LNAWKFFFLSARDDRIPRATYPGAFGILPAALRIVNRFYAGRSANFAAT
jgi:hypothetical protein